MIGGHREAGVGVAESLGDNLDRCAGGDEQTGVRVAQVVEADAGEVGAGQLPIKQLADRLGCTARPAVFVKIGSPSSTE